MRIGGVGKGFTVLEVMIDITIFALVALAVMTAYAASFKSMQLATAKTAAVAIANSKMEELRNLPYDDLATAHGPIYPPGNILDDETILQRGVQFNVHTVISYVDDPADGNAAGTISGQPKDLYPYDYKKAEVTVSKVGMNGNLARLTSNFAAKAAETPSNSGIVNVCIVDAAGQPVSGANITLTNSNVSPSVNIVATAADDGCIMVPNLPPDSHNEYHLAATMPGYSTDSTYPRTSQNPNALFPDVDVLIQQVTNQTLIIDKVGTLNIDVYNTAGVPVTNTPVHIASAKLAYFNPDTPKYETDATTDSNGHIHLSNMEFGGYNFSVNGYNVVSTSPYQPSYLQPDNTLNTRITVSASSYPTISTVEPITGVTGQLLSIAVNGLNFDSDVTIKLISSSNQEIAGSAVSISNGGKILEADFDLSGASAGFWDVLIESGGQTVRQYGGIEIKGGS